MFQKSPFNFWSFSTWLYSRNMVCLQCAHNRRALVFFFKEKINSYRYSRFNLTPFFRVIRTEKSTVLRTGKNHDPRSKFINSPLAEASVEPLIYCGLWPPWSPDSESVCYLWQTFTNRVYVFNTNSVHEMKYHIRGRIVNIPEKSCCLCRSLYFQKLRCWISAFQDSSLKVR